MQTVYHLRLLVADLWNNADDSPTCDEVIASLTSDLEFRLASLESIYLPSLNYLPVDDVDGNITASLQSLARCCQSRNIEVVYEEQSDENKAECQSSEEFMRRMTMKRIEKEVLL